MSVVSLTITQKDKIVIIAPHPDDECIGAGGLICLYPKQCDIYVMTDGSQGQKSVKPTEERKIRKYQFQKEMEYVQVNRFFWMGYEDGTLLGKKHCMNQIDFSPYTKIFLPWNNDNHPDHTATFLYAVERIKQQDLNNVEVYQYEVHVPFHDVTNYVDITDVIDQKKYLIQFHEDQVKNVCYDEIAISLAKYRACQSNQPQKYYECFFKVNLCEQLVSKETAQREQQVQKYRQFYRLFLRWIKVKQNKKNISYYLITRGWKHITIYGYGDVGILLCDELKNAKICINDVLDKRDLRTNTGKMTSKPENGNRNVDVVIVTAIFHFDEIKCELESLGYKNIISLQSIVEELDL